METKPEVMNTQHDSSVATPHGQVSITQAELDELKRRADVSSQNFERLKKEELRVAELEAQLALNSTSVDPEDPRVDRLASELSSIKSEMERREVVDKYPQLKELWKDLEDFRSQPENSGMGLKTAAKAFMIEKGLLEQRRPGLEQTTGGTSAPVKTGYSADEIKKLRETNYKKYLELVQKDQIGPIT